MTESSCDSDRVPNDKELVVAAAIVSVVTDDRPVEQAVLNVRATPVPADVVNHERGLSG
jgi:hypothetical protein